MFAPSDGLLIKVNLSLLDWINWFYITGKHNRRLNLTIELHLTSIFWTRMKQNQFEIVWILGITKISSRKNTIQNDGVVQITRSAHRYRWSAVNCAGTQSPPLLVCVVFSDICVVFSSVYVVFCKFVLWFATVYCVSHICFVFYIFVMFWYIYVVFCMSVLRLVCLFCVLHVSFCVCMFVLCFCTCGPP